MLSAFSTIWCCACCSYWGRAFSRSAASSGFVGREPQTTRTIKPKLAGMVTCSCCHHRDRHRCSLELKVYCEPIPSSLKPSPGCSPWPGRRTACGHPYRDHHCRHSRDIHGHHQGSRSAGSQPYLDRCSLGILGKQDRTGGGIADNNRISEQCLALRRWIEDLAFLNANG